MSRYAPRSEEDVAHLIAEYPLGLVVSTSGGGFAATPLPLLAERGSDGRILSLLGHFARSNPQVEALSRDPRAAILFQGPQGYVSPRLVSNLTWGPTWNYAMVKFDAEIAFVPDENDHAIRTLARSLESDPAHPWTPDRMGDRYKELVKRVVAFRATVQSMEAKFKLGQDEAPETFDQIVQGIDNRDLAAWMVRTARK